MTGRLLRLLSGWTPHLDASTPATTPATLYAASALAGLIQRGVG